MSSPRFISLRSILSSSHIFRTSPSFLVARTQGKGASRVKPFASGRERHQRLGELAQPKRLLEARARPVPLVDALNAVAGREQRGDRPLLQQIGDWKAALAGEVHVE